MKFALNALYAKWDEDAKRNNTTPDAISKRARHRWQRKQKELLRESAEKDFMEAVRNGGVAQSTTLPSLAISLKENE